MLTTKSSHILIRISDFPLILRKKSRLNRTIPPRLKTYFELVTVRAASYKWHMHSKKILLKNRIRKFLKLRSVQVIPYSACFTDLIIRTKRIKFEIKNPFFSNCSHVKQNVTRTKLAYNFSKNIMKQFLLGKSVNLKLQQNYDTNYC